MLEQAYLVAGGVLPGYSNPIPYVACLQAASSFLAGDVARPGPDVCPTLPRAVWPQACLDEIAITPGLYPPSCGPGR